MFTFASAVGTLHFLVLWQHHTLLHIYHNITKLLSSFGPILRYFYHFFFEKINIEYAKGHAI